MNRGTDLAQQVIDLVGESTGGKGEAEAMVDSATVSFTRFANSFIHQNMTETATTARLRLHVDGRTSTGYTTVVDQEGLRNMVERTVSAARLLPPDPGWPGLAEARPTEGSGNADDATAGATPDERAQVVADFVAACEGLEAAGFCQTAYSVTTFANSAGQLLEGMTTSAVLDGIARTGSSDGSARIASVRLGELDGGRLGARAATKASSSVETIELPPQEYPVVLEPSAATDILTWLGYAGFNARALAEGRSFLVLGEQQFAESVNLIDDPLSAGAIGLPFDVEGTPKKKMVLVGGGVSRAVVHDRRTAREMGAESTGHAIPGGESFGAFPLNLSLEPGTDGSTEDLISRVERGLLVTEFNYTNILDPRTLVVTGLTRNGLWLIEDGKVAQAVANLRFTQAYPAALAPGAVVGISSDAELLPISFEGVYLSAPSLHLASWRFTGGASG